MSIKTYKYNYNWHEASAEIAIDTEKINSEDCKQLLEFFNWDWDEDLPIHDELARLYAATAMRFATQNGHNLIGVLEGFKEAEGYPVMDGTYGITLLSVHGIDFSEIELELE